MFVLIYVAEQLNAYYMSARERESEREREGERER
jgi:hypothetical protein